MRDLIRSMTKKSDNYDEKYLKIKFNSNDYLPLKKMLELYNMVIFVRCVTQVYYLQLLFFLLK